MTEDQIERAVERMIDKADKKFLSGEMTDTEYDMEISIINRWSKEEYKRSKSHR